MNRRHQFTTPITIVCLDPITHTDEQPVCLNDPTCPCRACLVCEDRNPLHLRHCTRCKRLVCLQHSRRSGFLVLCQECEAS